MKEIELNSKQRAMIIQAIKNVHALAQSYGIEKLNMNNVIKSVRKDLDTQSQNFLICVGLAMFEEGLLNSQSEEQVEENMQ